MSSAQHAFVSRMVPAVAGRMDTGSSPTASFLGEGFPEQFFPPVATDRPAYEATCRRGYATMAGKRVVVTGLARNLGSILPTTIRRLERLCRLFADYRVVVYENDSTDNTKLLLRKWALDDRRVRAVSEDRNDPVNPGTRCLKRVERMALYRQRCQETILDDHRQFDAVIVVDLDILGGWSEDGIANSFGQRHWDFIGANGLIYRRDGHRINTLRQYDTWAFRVGDDCKPFSTAVAGGFLFRCGEPLVPVASCFGGLGIYQMPAYEAGEYSGDDVEHVGFHRSMSRRGLSRIFLNPSQIVMYGRRHRTGDALTGSMLAAWSWCTGRPGEPWMFARGERPDGEETGQSPAIAASRAA
jgi:hypothetical protein